MKLTNKNIDETCKSIYEKTLEYSEDSRLALKTRLMAEEILLGYQSKFGEEIDFDCIFRKRFGRGQTILTVSGNQYYPLDEENQDEILRSMTASFNNTPFWTYQNGTNTITWICKKKKNIRQVVMLLISIVAAIVAALICMLLPDSVREIIQGKIIGELLSAFMNIIKCIAGPLVFISIVWGIYCIGDVSQVRTIGRKMMGRFLLFAFLFPLVMMAAAVPFFIVSSSGGESFDIFTLYKMILDIIPSNIVTPFGEGNTLQIVFLAIAFGIGVLILGKRTSILTQATEQLNFVVQLAMDAISGLISIFVFLSVFDLIVSGALVNLAGVIKVIPIMLVGCFVPMMVFLIRVSIKLDVPILLLVKKQFPTFLVALTTSSSAAAFEINTTCCEKRLGIDKKIVNFGVPIGQVVFVIGSIMSFISIGLCMGDVFGIEISVKWLIMMFIMSFILGIATPPIPGGSIACFTIFAGQLGLPDNSVSMCIAISIIMDFIATATNLFCLQLELVSFSSNIGLLNEEVLREK